MSEENKDNKTIIITTPRIGKDMFEELFGDKLFEWQKELTDKIERGEIFWRREQYMQEPLPIPTNPAEAFTRRQTNAMFGRLNADRLACVGCGDILHYPKKFPAGFPKDKVLCCKCLGDYCWSVGFTHKEIVRRCGMDYEYDHTYRWGMFKTKILEAMRIQ